MALDNRRQVVADITQKMKQTDRPDSVSPSGKPDSDDSHSSRPRITPGLKLSTRMLSEPPQCMPI